MRDHVYDQVPFRLTELEHKYGPNVHIVADPFMLTQLASLCAKETIQPEINRLVGALYGELARLVVSHAFPRVEVSVPTRMVDHTPQGIFHGQLIAKNTRAVVVNIARAGTLPSQVTYDLLNGILDPRLVRQDHIIMSRLLGESEQVVGAGIGGAKIGGDIDDAFVLFPDPMGATGGSLSTAIKTYKDKVQGTARKFVCINMIVTPEYLKRITTEHPDVLVYAIRIDRGLSPPEIFSTIPGTHWDKERGLSDKQYIVPGGGGFGEIMNNAYV
ncbi:MAG: uracil phosphoribosyltransferase [Deltaproteobacteria bacterium]|nr:uracil phosphoribosyltransferase [Deltaproteobacteria bacterium]